MPGLLAVSSLHINKGRAGRRSPLLAELPEGGPFGDTPLYLLCDPGDSALKECEGMLGVARRVLERSQGSATGAIMAALRQVDELGTSDASREGAGFTCLALRGEEVYLAVRGLGVVIVRQGGRLRRVVPPPNISVSDGELHRYTLAPGDALLACSSRIDHLASLQMLGTAFSADPSETLRKLSLITQEEEGFTALLVSRA